LQFDTVLNINSDFTGLLFNNMQTLQQVGLAWSASTSGVSIASGVLCEIRFSYIGNISDLNFKNACEFADFNADVMSVSFTDGSISESFTVEVPGINSSYCTSENAISLTGSPDGGTFKIDGSPATTFDPAALGAGAYLLSYEYDNGYGFGDTININVDVFANPTISISSSGTICFGQASGEATVNILTGQTPYNYNWSDGQLTQTALSLVDGTYSVTVIDGNGCTTIDNILIQSSAEIIYDLTISHLSGLGANDGAIDLSITSGSSPFLTDWSNGSSSEDLTSLTPGMYSLTITDNLGCAQEDSALVKILSSQEIHVPAQWSLASFNVDLLEPLADSAFIDIESNLLLAKDEDGAVYWVFFGLNNIGDIIVGEAYQIKMTSADTINKPGYYIFPELTPIDLPIGWSLFGYIRTSPGLIVPILAPIITNVLLVKNGSGSVYWPAFELDLIIDMFPGEGYQIKMLAQSQLIYPPN